MEIIWTPHRGEKKVLWASEAQREIVKESERKRRDQIDGVKGKGKGSMQTGISKDGVEDVEPWVSAEGVQHGS